MTDTVKANPSTATATVDRLDSIGTGAPPADSAPVSPDDRAVMGVFADLDAALAPIGRLADARSYMERSTRVDDLSLTLLGFR